ncbi:MAG: nucleoside-diphosphate sugar epimerase/dehydratase [Caldilineales bacterium]
MPHLRIMTLQTRFSFILNLHNRHFLIIDLLLLCITPSLALMLRIDGIQALNRYNEALLFYIGGAMIIRVVIFYFFDLYSRYWRYASINEMAQITVAVIASSLIVIFVFFMLRLPVLGICSRWEFVCGLPRSVPFTDALLVLFAVGAARFSVRTADLYLYRSRPGHATQRVLIMGAGEAGAMIARELNANPHVGLDPIGFIDDDPQKLGVRIRGLPVLGTREDLQWLAVEHKIHQMIIAMPTASGKSIREVLTLCKEIDLPAKIMPGIYELLDGTVSISQLRNVEIEDLLRREPVQTDTAAVQQLLQGRCVLVTGGGGSIGSELCRQILRSKPAKLVILGHGENSIFEISQQLGRQYSDGAGQDSAKAQPLPEIVPLIADIRFEQRLQSIFTRHRPQIVFHAAAHKHVPLMEENPCEAISNNVLGTRNLLRAAEATGVEHFVFISTDKAVNPTNVMGASKRTAELMIHNAARRTGKPYVAVRFGNVLGSRGSVVLTFKQQIAAGGPVTVTDRDMTRFFMTIPEAVQLVLQAATLGAGGETFVLDMGEPVRILDMAQDLIRLSGLETGRDIDIVFTGLRPGEKLHEELFTASETHARTAHTKIFLASDSDDLSAATTEAMIDTLITTALNNNASAIRPILQQLIPEFSYRTAISPSGLDGDHREQRLPASE